MKPLIWACLILPLGMTAVQAAAQDVTGGITTEKLEPLEPARTTEGAVDSDNRFKPAPFKLEGPTTTPVMIDPIATGERQGAKIRQLDKMTGRIQTFEVQAGSEVTVDRLRVRLDVCRSPEDNAQHGTMAFVEIWDTKHEGQPAAFSGWMFAESPALSAMDHPRYDLWVMSCTTS